MLRFDGLRVVRNRQVPQKARAVLRVSFAAAVLGAWVASIAACGLSVVGERAEPDLGEQKQDGAVGEASLPPTNDAGSSRDAAASDDASDAGEDVDSGLVTTVDSFAVSASSLQLDLASSTFGAVSVDSIKDGVFDVVVTGPVIAMALFRTDDKGMPILGQQWDTWVGTDAIPPAANSAYATGGGTYTLGVYEATVLRNDTSGRVALGPGTHTLQLGATNVGTFTAGSFYRVVVETPEHAVAMSSVVAY